MSRKNLLNFKNIFSLVIVVLLIVVTVILVTLNNKTVFNDDYFKSDGTKIVLSTHTGTVGDDKTPTNTYMVYYYSGNNITSVKQFYKFEYAEKTQEAYDELDVSNMEWVKTKSINGQYLILELTEDQYEGLTTEIVRKSVESIEATDEEPESDETNE